MSLQLTAFHLFFVIVLCTYDASGLISYDPTEIHGYHFHTYFFQKNADNLQEALHMRKAIQYQINTGKLTHCRLNRVNHSPRGPHPIGSFETCCNKSSISPALSWFMLNHGNLSILLHPLTRFEVRDHTHRSMFLGPRLPLDISVLDQDLGDGVDLCLPLQKDSSQNYFLNKDGVFNDSSHQTTTTTATEITPQLTQQHEDNEMYKWYVGPWMEEITNNTFESM